MMWMQTFTDRKMDVTAPDEAPIDFLEIAIVLARINRYTGHTSRPFSVAQHCVIGHDALRAKYPERPDFALAFLLHDAHEAYTGDIATPIQNALEHFIAQILLDHQDMWGVHNDSALTGAYQAAIEAGRGAFRRMKSGLDAVIFKAAGAEFPMDPEVKDVVRAMDRVMLVTERRDLMGPSPGSWGEYDQAEPLNQTIYPWQRHVAAQRWLSRLETYMGKIDRAAPAKAGWDWGDV
jgi:hypothetical protein